MVSIHMPLHLRGSDDFEYLRNYLRAADFNEESICSRLDIRGLQELLSGVRMRVTLSNKSDELGILTRLFLFGESFMKGELGAVFPSRLPEVLANLGLV